MLLSGMRYYAYPGPCRNHEDPFKLCTCTHQGIPRSQKRISGPLLNRIEIHFEVPRVDYEKLSDHRLGEPSQKIQAGMEAARQIQREQFAESDLLCNAGMRTAEIREHYRLDKVGKALMRNAMNRMQLSARIYHRRLKLGKKNDLSGRPHHRDWKSFLPPGLLFRS